MVAGHPEEFEVASDGAEVEQAGVHRGAGALGVGGELRIALGQGGEHVTGQRALRLVAAADVTGLQDRHETVAGGGRVPGGEVEVHPACQPAGGAVVERVAQPGRLIRLHPGLQGQCGGRVPVQDRVLAAGDVHRGLRYPGGTEMFGHLVEDRRRLLPGEEHRGGDDLHGLLVLPEQVRVTAVALAGEPLRITVVHGRRCGEVGEEGGTVVDAAVAGGQGQPGPVLRILVAGLAGQGQCLVDDLAFLLAERQVVGTVEQVGGRHRGAVGGRHAVKSSDSATRSDSESVSIARSCSPSGRRPASRAWT
jgi:hypothetical protein